MKTKLFILAGLCSVFLLSGCTSGYLCTGGGCGYGYYDYPSQCGLPSCTDNSYIVQTTYYYSCPGVYCAYGY